MCATRRIGRSASLGHCPFICAFGKSGCSPILDDPIHRVQQGQNENSKEGWWESHEAGKHCPENQNDHANRNDRVYQCPNLCAPVPFHLLWRPAISRGECNRLGQLLRTGVGVEKVRDRNVFLAAMIAAAEFFVLTSAKRQLP